MRIRKRSQSVAPATTTTPVPLPISCKYQTSAFSPSSRFGAIAECSNMQTNRCRELQDHEPPVMDSLRLSDAHVKDEEDDDLSGPEETSIPADKARRRQSSPKRRKIEHESNLVFEGSASMTAAELLVVNELANGVRQRLHAASEHSATSEVTKAVLSKPVENSKDALISSIFFVFGTCGENGLSASEVVKYMLDQRLPGLKEGGARHTVQVANVLRSSSSFISLGDKKYLLCSNLDVSRPKRQQQQAHKSSPARSPSPGSSSLDSSENEDISPQPKPRSRMPASKSPHSSRSGKKSPDVKALAVEVVVPADGEPVVVKTTRRRGPSSSQKGKGPTQCKRYDGRGWQCSRLTEPGYSLCVHHQDLINKRAAKLKEQQTLSRLMESSQHRKPSKSQQQQQQLPPLPPTVETPTTESRVTAPSSNNSGAPVQKRKMLSLLAIK